MKGKGISNIKTFQNFGLCDVCNVMREVARLIISRITSHTSPELENLSFWSTLKVISTGPTFYRGSFTLLAPSRSETGDVGHRPTLSIKFGCAGSLFLGIDGH